MNKVLFQTQNYRNRRLLHRLNVLNPLSNSDILGDVEYFSVEGMGCLPVDSPIHTQFPQVASPLSMKEDEPWTRCHEVVDSTQDPVIETTDKKMSKLYVETKLPQRTAVVLNQSIKSPLPKGILTRFSLPVESNTQVVEPKRACSLSNAGTGRNFGEWLTSRGKKDKGHLLVWNAVRIGTDDHFLRKHQFRALFREHAIQLDDAKLFQMPDVVGQDQVDQPGEECNLM